MKHSVACCSASLFGLVLALAITTPVAKAALVDWQVDTAQSYLRLTIPNQAVSILGTPSGTAFLRTQAAPFGGWTSGNVARIGGTVSTHYSDFSSIEFLGGVQNLVGLNSGNYRPSPAVWDPQTNLFTNVSTTGTVWRTDGTANGALTVVKPSGFVFDSSVQYDLASGNLPVAGGSFNASAVASPSSAEVARCRCLVWRTLSIGLAARCRFFHWRCQWCSRRPDPGPGPRPAQSTGAAHPHFRSDRTGPVWRNGVHAQRYRHRFHRRLCGDSRAWRRRLGAVGWSFLCASAAATPRDELASIFRSSNLGSRASSNSLEWQSGVSSTSSERGVCMKLFVVRLAALSAIAICCQTQVPAQSTGVSPLLSTARR